jgi:hypothetical protein
MAEIDAALVVKPSQDERSGGDDGLQTGSCGY